MKVVVYDCGWGGEAFAEALEREMPVIEVIRVIDWRNAPYCGRRKGEIRRLAEDALMQFIDKVDAIVLASYEVTAVALKFLRFKYPGQVFIGMSWPVLRQDERQVVVMTTDLVRRSRDFRRRRARMEEGCAVQICDEWMQAVDDENLSEQKIRMDVARTRRLQPKVVVLGCTNLVDVRQEIERAYGGALVLDGYRATIKNLCRVLRFRGGMADRGRF